MASIIEGIDGVLWNSLLIFGFIGAMLVVFGGIGSIAKVADILVPTMAGTPFHFAGFPRIGRPDGPQYIEGSR